MNKGDTIYRQAAIDAIDESRINGTYLCYSDKLIDKLRLLPSAQPERKKGKWYKPTGMMPPEFHGRHRCSECDEFAMHDWKHHREQLTNFCPNCGADMRGIE